MGVAVRATSLRAAGDNICNLSDVGVAPSFCLRSAGLERERENYCYYKIIETAEIHLATHLAAMAAAFFLSLFALAVFSTSLWASSSLLGALGILKVGPLWGVRSVSRWKGVPSIVPQVISGDASTPKNTK